MADWHFTPTRLARENLLREGVPPERILTTGNTVVDALLWMVERVREECPPLPASVEEALAQGRQIVLVTGTAVKTWASRSGKSAPLFCGSPNCFPKLVLFFRCI